ncbi:hypothetical protein PGT21_026860 [Puccinia graminis f. sp. tritici]|uniref:Uncharacterized protein n=1 Tax=Puccinia graminis f. sp. tritici TaxID=56615 RepID=A0A5B0MSF5_PUCGR|nr:hypothetical protein PGT21_026860 [Puccinia graminis f. sp. tritici]
MKQARSLERFVSPGRSLRTCSSAPVKSKKASDPQQQPAAALERAERNKRARLNDSSRPANRSVPAALLLSSPKKHLTPNSSLQLPLNEPNETSALA